MLAALWGDPAYDSGEANEAREEEEEEGRRQTVKILVDLGADLTARGDLGRSVVLGAAHCGCIDLITRLIHQGWDITDSGLTQLHL